MKRINFVNKVIDYILVILLVMLSLFKGGFYKSDILLVSMGVSIISLVRIIILIYNNVKNKNYTIDIISILLLLLSFSYVLPIMFNNYADLNSSIYEAVRYFSLYFVYTIVKNSDNKKMYVYTIIAITLLQCILSVDAVGSRYLENFLTYFDSGYLDRDYTRMSGTLQYANVLAILCMISVIFANHFIHKKKNIWVNSVLYVAIFILVSTIILTGCRTVILLCIISAILYFVINRKNIVEDVLIYIPLAGITGIYSSLMYKNMLSTRVYAIFLIFILLSFVFRFMILILHNIYLNKLKKKINSKLNKNYKIIIFSLFILLSLVYCIIAISYTKPLIVKDTNNMNSKYIILNNIKENNNLIVFSVVGKGDIRYSISLNKIENNGNEENIKVFNYYDNVSGNFKYEFNLDNNVKYLKMYIKCDKGEITLNNLYLNSKKEKLDYVLIPNEMMYRFKDLFAGSTSTSDRITYYFDALKIATKSIKNFVIGTGGEGFNNIYEQVKTKEYSSTEVHSSFLQILVEAGIIGFSITVVLLVYVIIKSKNSYIKFAYLIFVLHSFVDLNFSYMLGIYVFGILIAILDFNNTKDSNYINKYVSYISYILAGIFAIFTIVLSLRAWFALYMNIPIYTDENLNLTSQIEVVNKNEKRVMLDPYEFSYRKSLDIEYSTYLDLLFNQVNQINDEEKKIVLNNEIKNVIENKLNNADIILKNNKYNSAQIMYACKIYIDLFKYLRYMNEGCNKYINVVKEKMMFLSEIYPKDKVLENNINEILNQL